MATRKVTKRGTKKPAKRAEAAKVVKATKTAKVKASAHESASGFIDRHETVQSGLEALSHRAQNAELKKVLRDLGEAYARLLGRTH